MAFGSESEDSGTISEEKRADVVIAEGSADKSPRKKYVCSNVGCNRSFSRPWRLEAHEFVHSGVAPFACDFLGCDKRYTSRTHLTRHKKSAHSPIGSTVAKLIPCPFEGCKVQLKTNQNVKKHYKRAHVDNVCPDCGQSFSKDITYKYHMQYHTGNFIFSCDECGLKFARRTEYGRHMRGHRIYCCPFEGCDLAFETWSLIRKHLTTHESSYICYLCRKTYNRERTFRVHLLTHLPGAQKRKTVLKRFACHYCNTTVCGKQSLHRHIKNIHLNPRKWTRKPSGPRAPRRDKGLKKGPLLPLSAVLSGLPCSSRMAKELVNTYEPVFDNIAEMNDYLIDSES